MHSRVPVDPARAGPARHRWDRGWKLGASDAACRIASRGGEAGSGAAAQLASRSSASAERLPGSALKTPRKKTAVGGELHDPEASSPAVRQTESAYRLILLFRHIAQRRSRARGRRQAASRSSQRPQRRTRRHRCVSRQQQPSRPPTATPISPPRRAARSRPVASVQRTPRIRRWSVVRRIYVMCRAFIVSRRPRRGV